MPSPYQRNDWTRKQAMKAVFHPPDGGEEEEVDILDIFVDKGGAPKVLFLGSDDTIATAPTNRFTNFENEAHTQNWYRQHM